MKGNRSYIIYLLVLVGILALVVLSQEKSYNWNVTLAPEDKNPYGSYALNELLPDIFKDNKVTHSFMTFYEMKDSSGRDDNWFVLCSNFHPDREDTRALLNHVKNGGSAFVSASYFYGDLADTLGIETRDYLFGKDNDFTRSDTAEFHVVNPQFDTLQTYYMKRENSHNYFYRSDTSVQTKSMGLPITVISKNDLDQPVTIRIAYGKGHLILNCTPMAFTNIYLLAKDNTVFASAALSYLPVRPVLWAEYYQRGRREVETPLRFILTNEPLSWAYYITIFSILLFMIFEAKRRQRIIPIIKPLSNTTLEFVSTIGNLYYESGDHKNIAEKKIAFFFDQVRRQYFITLPPISPEYQAMLSRKAGKDEREVETLLRCIKSISESKRIEADELVKLNELIERFWVTDKSITN